MLAFPRSFRETRRREFHHCVYIYVHTHRLHEFSSDSLTYTNCHLPSRSHWLWEVGNHQRSTTKIIPLWFFMEKRAHFESLQLSSRFWAVFLWTSKPVWNLHASHYSPKALVHQQKDMNLKSWWKFVPQFPWSAQLLCNSFSWAVHECLWLCFSHHQFKEAK